MTSEARSAQVPNPRKLNVLGMLLVAVVLAVPSAAAGDSDFFGSFDLATGIDSRTEASVLVHFRAILSGGTRPLIVLESEEGDEILRVEFNGNGRILYFSDGPGNPKRAIENYQLDYGAILVLRLNGSSYEAAINDHSLFTLNTNLAAPATRAWSDRAGTATRIVYNRIAFGGSDLEATTFGDESMPGWSEEGPLLGSKEVESNHLTGDRSPGFVWIHARAAPSARDSFWRPLARTGATYWATGAFSMSPYVEDFAEGIALLAGVKEEGTVAWAVIARTIGYRTWELTAVDGDGSSSVLGATQWIDCQTTCDPWVQWHALDFQVDEETGAWEVSLDGLEVAEGDHGSGATRIAFGDIFDGPVLVGPSGAGGVRIDNVFTASNL